MLVRMVAGSRSASQVSRRRVELLRADPSTLPGVAAVAPSRPPAGSGRAEPPVNGANGTATTFVPSRRQVPTTRPPATMIGWKTPLPPGTTSSRVLGVEDGVRSW